VVATHSEADDVIATMCARLCEAPPITNAAAAVAAPPHVVMVSTADEDFHSVLSEGSVVMLHQGYPSKACPEGMRLITESVIQRRLGLSPAQHAHCKALAGKRAAGVVGVPGLSMASARELVRRFGGVEQVSEWPLEHAPRT